MFRPRPGSVEKFRLRLCFFFPLNEPVRVPRAALPILGESAGDPDLATQGMFQETAPTTSWPILERNLSISTSLV